MIHALQHKALLVTPPAALIDNAAVTTALIDTFGFDYLDVLVIIGATDIGLTVLKLQAGDASDGSDLADVTGFAFGATGKPALPAATDDNKMFHFGKSLLGGKRYYDVSATVGDGTVGGFVTVIAILSRAHQMPSTAAQRGYAAEIID